MNEEPRLDDSPAPAEGPVFADPELQAMYDAAEPEHGAAADEACATDT